MPAGQADAAPHGLLEVALLLGLDVGHGEDVDDEVERLELGQVEVGVEGVGDLHLETLALEPWGEDVDALLGLMALPAPPDDQGRPRLLGRRRGAGQRRDEAGEEQGE